MSVTLTNLKITSYSILLQQDLILQYQTNSGFIYGNDNIYAYLGNMSYNSTDVVDLSPAGNNGTIVGDMPNFFTSSSSRAYLVYVEFNGTNNGVMTNNAVTAPDSFTILAAVVPYQGSGKIVGFESSQGESSGSLDRHLFVDAQGKINFEVWDNSLQAMKTITTPTAYTNQNVLIQASFNGTTRTMKLYVGSTLIGTETLGDAPVSYTGYWKIAFGKIDSSYTYLPMQMRFMYVYNRDLTEQEILDNVKGYR